jgi:PEP-CTERM motif
MRVRFLLNPDANLARRQLVAPRQAISPRVITEPQLRRLDVNKPQRAIIRSAMAGVVGLLLSLSSAEAVVYRGTFDPPGPLFDFSGTFLVDIPDACLATDGNVFYPADCPGPPAPALTALHVDITGAVTTSFDFAPLPYVLNSFLVAGGEAVGINTAFLFLGSAGGYNFFVQFFTDDPVLSSPGIGLWTGTTCGTASGGGPGTNCTFQGSSTEFSMIRVPEPATWVLLLIALAGASMTLRRRPVK